MPFPSQASRHHPPLLWSGGVEVEGLLHCSLFCLEDTGCLVAAPGQLGAWWGGLQVGLGEGRRDL